MCDGCVSRDEMKKLLAEQRQQFQEELQEEREQRQQLEDELEELDEELLEPQREAFIARKTLDVLKQQHPTLADRIDEIRGEITEAYISAVDGHSGGEWTDVWL